MFTTTKMYKTEFLVICPIKKERWGEITEFQGRNVVYYIFYIKKDINKKIGEIQINFVG